MRVYLNVPYSDKDLAKRRGCRWDGIRKKWFVDDPMHMEMFMEWMPEHLCKPIKLIYKKASTASNVSKSRGKHGKV